MAGRSALVAPDVAHPAIHAFLGLAKEDVDARRQLAKDARLAGHDELVIDRGKRYTAIRGRWIG